jgi:hypothetical protein
LSTASSRVASRSHWAAAAFAVALCVAVGAQALAAGTTAVARTAVAFRPCRAHDLNVGGLPVTNLRVSGLPCNGAIAVLQAGTYARTPGGPVFSIRGFRCQGPVGPRPPGEKPRFYTCIRPGHSFEFLVPGFS